MNTPKQLITEINELTTDIETDYPELYHFIEEQPITIPSTDHPDPDEAALLDYLNSLKQLLKHHIETHQKN